MNNRSLLVVGYSFGDLYINEYIKRIELIHGSRLSAGDTYIIGHNIHKPENLYDTLNGELYFEQDTKNKIIGWMNGVRKDTSSIIHRNHQYFKTLKNIKHVEVIVHSLYEVDWPYFDEVARCISPNAQWIFHAHTAEDRQRITTYIIHSGIANYKIV